MTQDETLPTTDPATIIAAHDSNTNTYCFKIVGQHDMREAGESRWAHWGVLFATRLLSGLTFVALTALTILLSGRTKTVPALAGLIFSALTFPALAICSCFQGVNARASRKPVFSSAAVFSHSITASLSVFLITDFIVFASTDGFERELLILLSPFIAYLLDVIVMQSRIRLRYRYSLFFTVASTLYTLVILIGYTTVSCSNCDHAGQFQGAVLLNIVIGLIASLLAISLTRISCLFFENR